MINANAAKATHLLTFKLILTLNNNWEDYQQNQPYLLRQVGIKEVEKMLFCMDPEQGYSVYMCGECGSTKMVTKMVPHSFTCEKCNKGIMAPKNETNPIVRSYGLHEGFKLD